MCGEKHRELSVCHVFRGVSVEMLVSTSICLIVSVSIVIQSFYECYIFK